jgi:phosphohistidine phosphatase SixA
MKIQHLIILRHAPFEGRGFVTTEGRMLVEQLCTKLKEIYPFAGETTAIVCSLELRAVKTSQSIGMAIGTKGIRCYDEFYSSERRCDAEAALVVLRSYLETYNTVIVVTHEEMVPALTKLFGKLAFGKEFVTQSGDYLHGYGISCSNGVCIPLAP